jgi:hypothetical protein
MQTWWRGTVTRLQAVGWKKAAGIDREWEGEVL